MRQGLALFDFDGTITTGDTASLFYASLYKRKLSYFWRHILLCLPEFLAYRVGIATYLPLKRKRLQIHLGHLNEAILEERLANFRQHILPTILKSSALARIQWHKEQGHEIWIVSASFDFLLHDWSQQQEVGLLVNKTIKSPGRCTFLGEDCNFVGKVHQIKANLLLESYPIIYAYGDSAGDQAMLALAHQPYFNFFHD